MIEQLAVALIVIAASGVSAWKLMPARWRLIALLALDRRAARHPALSTWRSRALQPRIARAGGAGCAGCSANPSARAGSRSR